MSNAVSVSNYYRGFPPATSPYSAADSTRAASGYMEAAVAASGRHHRPPETSARRRLTMTGDSGVAEGGAVETAAVMESDSHSSGEDEDISVCSLDVTSSPTDVADTAVLNTLQIEAS